MLDITNLPENYLKAMQELLKEDYNLYIESLGKKPYSGIRVNTLKTTPEQFKELFKREFKPVPWTHNGFYAEDGIRLSKSPYYHAGLYYLQEPSAMAPAVFADIKPGYRVLDLCAAPGGKSTELAARLNGSGLLVANDISAARAKALLKNIELAGAGNVLITCEEPGRLVKSLEGYFDSILVDAPCSGEGMFRKDQTVLNEYKKRGSEFFVPVQNSILETASRLLKPGGSIMYSTCTYSAAENENIILNFLDRHGDFYIESLKICEGFSESDILKGCIRLFPHRLEGEGHFLARLRSSVRQEENSAIKAVKAGLKVKLPESCLSFLKHINRTWDKERFYVNKEYIYYLPEFYSLDKNIHYLRSGLLLGRMKNSRFEPSQALAMNLKLQEWDNPLNLSIEDNRVIKYLKGETLEDDSTYNDFRLVGVEGFPLGFIKQNASKCKNKYYPGWRMT